MSDESKEDETEPPMRVVVIGAGDTVLGRELAQRIMADPQLRGRIEIVDRFSDEADYGREILDLNAIVERIQAEHSGIMVPISAQISARSPEPYSMHLLDGKSKYDRQRKWWLR